jgi:hypothetical protein
MAKVMALTFRLYVEARVDLNPTQSISITSRQAVMSLGTLKYAFYVEVLFSSAVILFE